MGKLRMQRDSNVKETPDVTFSINSSSSQARAICCLCGTQGRPPEPSKDFRFFIRGGHVCDFCTRERNPKRFDEITRRAA
jgi:hypothetical protein